MSDCRFGVSPVNYPGPDDKTNKVTAPSEDSVQRGHPPSLVFAVRLMGSLGPKLYSCGQRKHIIRLGGS